MRLLVFGGWGQLGTELATVSARGHEVLRPRRAEVDVTDREAVLRTVCDAEPDAVVDAAAFHRLDACEADPLEAFRVNAVGARNVAAAAATAGARIAYVSTDYVFAGDRAGGYGEDDPVGPLNAYGASKAAGEWLVRQAAPEAVLVRCSGLFGHAGSSGKGGNFVETILAKAAAGGTVQVVDDLEFAPSAARDVAERLVALFERDVPGGTYHLANAGRCTWFGFARAILDEAGLAADLRPTRSEAGPARPRCSVLLDTRTNDLGLAPAREWRAALSWYLSSRPGSSRASDGPMTRSEG